MQEAMYVHHDGETQGAIDSAREVIPTIIQALNPQSVVDVGCGPGAWLSVVQEFGVTDLLGIEGDHLDKNKLLLKPHQILFQDLEKPFTTDKKFDLVMCLEVAEHLSPMVADSFVDSLVKLGDVLLFSAAIPHQGGYKHINEQWPNYWQEKFNKHGFLFYDVLRPLIWHNPKIKWWYRQNLFIIAHQKLTLPFPGSDSLRNLVHPECLEDRLDEIYTGKNIKLSFDIFLKSITRRLKVK
ncbi:MAG: methyltransferase domain-containing protein [Verrucomicrobia bacterium]|nr:methyltransferase domain-containing protein [Cytophagales bacterium]